MSIAHDIPFDTSFSHVPVPAVPPTTVRPLHRIADARRRQDISVRSAARRMQTSMEQVRKQEDPNCDMLLSDLHRWQRALRSADHGAAGRQRRAVIGARADACPSAARDENRARQFRNRPTSPSIQRFAAMLEQQLIELMPELKDVAAWHSVGQRRSPNELGRIAERVLPDSYFNDSLG